jgi:hypothetical protein
VTKCEENGCEIEVECTPILYRVMVQIPGMEEVNEVLIQDSIISCERFLKTVFSATLGATSLSEKKTTFPKSNLSPSLETLSLVKYDHLIDNGITRRLPTSAI